MALRAAAGPDHLRRRAARRRRPDDPIPQQRPGAGDRRAEARRAPGAEARHGELLEVQERLREARLFNKGVRTIKIHAGRVEDFTFGPAKGRTAIAYNVTLKRARPTK
jgi:hypothetical protein